MSEAINKAKNIRLLILDVDGVLTDGSLYYGNTGIDLKKFHVHDGLGIKLLKSAGIEVAIISAKTSPLVTLRLQDLDVEHVYLGSHNKLLAYHDIKQKLQIKDEEIAYMGDDLPDLPVLRKVGFSATVIASPIINLHHFDYISKNLPGRGAVREVCEFILEAQEKLFTMIQSYMDKLDTMQT